MTSLGRNADFVYPPQKEHRIGDTKLGPAATVQMAPVQVTSTDSVDGRRVTTYVAPDPTDVPQPGTHGIVVWEAPWTGYHGFDPVITSFSDISVVPAGSPHQLVHGTEVRVKLTNTVNRTFYGRQYAGRTMVDGLAGLSVGDLLTPVDSPSDSNGYWQKQDGSDAAWMKVTAVDTAANSIEAQLLF